MTKRIFRLFIAFVLFVSIFLVIRKFLVPDSFYELGPYRADAIEEIASAELKYADTATCKNCHADIDSIKITGAHSKVICQTCHGPGIKHVKDPEANKMEVPSGRKFCAMCHAKNPARPAFIGQVDTATHNKNSNCTKCHKAHNPSRKAVASATKDSVAAGSTGATCIMCHDDKNTLIRSGIHKTVLCQSCHGSGEKHMLEPAANKMAKPNTRAFCGTCHGIGIASATNGIKQVDLKEHNTDNNCSECHDPHSPFKGF